MFSLALCLPLNWNETGHWLMGCRDLGIWRYIQCRAMRFFKWWKRGMTGRWGMAVQGARHHYHLLDSKMFYRTLLSCLCWLLAMQPKIYVLAPWKGGRGILWESAVEQKHPFLKHRSNSKWRLTRFIILLIRVRSLRDANNCLLFFVRLASPKTLNRFSSLLSSFHCSPPQNSV